VVKSFDREKILAREARINQVMNERQVLLSTKFANLNRLVTTTKTTKWLCLVLELAEGVDLVTLLNAY
jgi:UDP-N-acetylglucosamine transferase subunit ALG13